MDKTKLLVVVDMQNDFIDGALGSDDAIAIVPKVCEKIDNWDGRVCFTMDTHYDDYSETTEGQHIPIEHCINDTPGWHLNDEVDKRRNADSFTVYKDTFGSTDLVDLVKYLDIETIQFIGLCTDICVVSNALLLRAHCPNHNISVDASCCAGTSHENHVAALVVMKSCCIDIINN